MILDYEEGNNTVFFVERERVCEGRAPFSTRARARTTPSPLPEGAVGRGGGEGARTSLLTSVFKIDAGAGAGGAPQ